MDLKNKNNVMDCSYSGKFVQLVLLASGTEEQSRALIGCKPKVISQELSQTDHAVFRGCGRQFYSNLDLCVEGHGFVYIFQRFVN